MSDSIDRNELEEIAPDNIPDNAGVLQNGLVVSDDGVIGKLDRDELEVDK